MEVKYKVYCGFCKKELTVGKFEIYGKSFCHIKCYRDYLKKAVKRK